MAVAGRLDGRPDAAGGGKTPEAARAAKVEGSSGEEKTFPQSPLAREDREGGWLGRSVARGMGGRVGDVCCTLKGRV